MARYQPYVEDFNSELSEAIPLTRRQATKRSSGLANSTSADASSYEAEGASVSDSGYSSHAEATTPTETPPPQKSQTPAPPPPQTSRTQQSSTRPSRSPSNPAPAPFTRPSSKSFSRAQSSPAVPRNIPSSYNTTRRELRESSPTTSTGGSDDCDCPDCGKTPSKPVTSGNTSNRNSGVWSVPEHSSYHGSYSSSPSSYAGYQYPMKYDGYSEGAPAHVGYTEPSREGGSSRRERSSTQSSMPPPPRPLSSFAGSSTTTSSHTPSGSWSQASYNSGYFGSHHSSPAAPTPASTCPPTYSSSMYPPPPIDTSVPGPSPHSTYEYSPYAPPSSTSSYGHSYTPDPWSQSPVPQTPNYHQASEPSYHPAVEYSSMPPPPPIINRRNSMRAQANAGAVLESSSDYPHPQVSHHRERRPSNRVHSGERPSSWYGQSQFQEVPSRSISVPPAQSEPAATISSSSRRVVTPQPIRRRDSNTSQGSGSHSSRLPSALSRAMETCAIDDEPHHRSSRHGHSYHRSSGHYEYHHGAVARRDTGTMMQSSHSNRSSDSGSSGHSHDGREELLVLDSDEPFTMRYPAGVPVKLQLNGGQTPRTISLGSRNKNENVEFSTAYKYIQQRQQQVHAQLEHGVTQMDHYDRRATGDYSHRSYERQRV